MSSQAVRAAVAGTFFTLLLLTATVPHPHLHPCHQVAQADLELLM